MAKNTYTYFRNDFVQDFFEFDPKNPQCLDAVGYKYFGRVLNLLEPHIRDRGLAFHVTGWTVKELPSYGPNVISCILQDEWGREPHYRCRVGMIFKTCGTTPFDAEAYKFGSAEDFIANILGQGKAAMRGADGMAKSLTARIKGKSLAPVYDIPLGCFAYADVPMIPIEEREYDLYFAGSVQHMPGKQLVRRPKELARNRMGAALTNIGKTHPDIKILTTVTAGFEESITNSTRRYLENMANTRICPIPRGANLETFRFYEAIRHGCIPVGEAFPSNDLYQDAPVIRLKDWSELETLAPALLKDKDRLQEYHKKALEWWDKKCSEQALAIYLKGKIDAGFD